MKKLKTLLIIYCCMVFGIIEAKAEISYENLAPAQFSGRLGIGNNIENKKEIQAKSKKSQKQEKKKIGRAHV